MEPKDTNEEAVKAAKIEEDRRTQERIREAAPEMLKLLKSLEFFLGAEGGHCYCPICLQTCEQGHAEDCALGNILKKVES